MMTVEDLLCHRSGLITFDGDLLWYGTNYTREEIIERIRYRPLSQGYRTDFGYQNIMYITAGELIESVTGKSWDENVKERIFKPLGMVQSNTSISQYKPTQQIAYPHIEGKKQALLNYDNSGATAAINSNLTDLSKWISMWANEGVYDGDTIISKESFDRITRLHTVIPTGGLDRMVATNFKGYGLGWFLFDYKGQKVVHHGGGLPGYITKLAFVPEKDLGIVVLTNDMSSLTTAMMYEILEAYSAEDTTDFISLFTEFAGRGDAYREQSLKAKEDKKNLDNAPSFERAAYVGVYEDKMYGKAEVSIRGKRRKSHLFIELLPSKELFHGKLEPFNGDTYKVVFNDPFLPPGYVTFSVEDEAVSGFTINLENPDFHFYKLDFKKK
jgi:CubicO group peptidase (beta-lactamase class C family)